MTRKLKHRYIATLILSVAGIVGSILGLYVFQHTAYSKEEIRWFLIGSLIIFSIMFFFLVYKYNITRKKDKTIYH